MMPEDAGIRAAGISDTQQAPAWQSPRLSARARRSRLAFLLPLACLAASLGPGRPGLRRCRQGGLACPAGDRFLGAGGQAGRMLEDAWFRQPGFQDRSKPLAWSSSAFRRIQII